MGNQTNKKSDANNFQPPDFDSGPFSDEEYQVKNFGSENSNTLKKQGLENLDQDFILQHNLSDQEKDSFDFSASNFVEQQTFLTNIEDYTRKIKIDAQNHANRMYKKVDLIKTEIELELADAATLKKQAEEQAKVILDKANLDAKTIRSKAFEEGRKKGFDEGISKSQTQSVDRVKELDILLHEINLLRESLMIEYESEIIDFCLLMAKKVIHREVKSNEDMVHILLQKMIKKFEGEGNIKIKINPIEYDYIAGHNIELEKYLEENQRLTFRSDPDVPAASPIIETAFFKIDTDIKEQIKIMDEEINNALIERTQRLRKSLSKKKIKTEKET